MLSSYNSENMWFNQKIFAQILPTNKLCLIFFPFLLYFRGVTPAEAEMNYLNTAKMLDLYGVDIHTVMVSNLMNELRYNVSSVNI